MDKSPFQQLRPHWRLVTAAVAGWALDAFDSAMLLLLMPHLSQVFDVSLATMTLIVTGTAMMKVVGAVTWGALADRYGRRLMFMVGVVWFACFCGLSGLAWSYASFLALRILFGIGFGGEWSVSAALLMETLPEKARGLASGMMMAGYEIGYLCAALVFREFFPAVSWRWFFIIGLVPALLVIFIRTSVKESPEWEAARARPVQLPRPRFRITPPAIQAWAFMLFLGFMNWVLLALYPTFLITVRHLQPSEVFPYIALYSVASIIGKPLAGRVATAIGEKPMLLIYLVATLPISLLYTVFDNPVAMIAGAFLMGLVANSIFGVLPAYLARRFPGEHRALGIGIGWGMNGLSAVSPFIVAKIIPVLGLPVAMALGIAVGSALAALCVVVNTDRWMPKAEPVPEPASA